MLQNQNNGQETRFDTQYSNMTPRLSGQNSIYVAFFVSKSLMGSERQKKLKKFTDSFEPKASEPYYARHDIDISNVAYSLYVMCLQPVSW